MDMGRELFGELNITASNFEHRLEGTHLSIRDAGKVTKAFLGSGKGRIDHAMGQKWTLLERRHAMGLIDSDEDLAMDDDLLHEFLGATGLLALFVGPDLPLLDGSIDLYLERDIFGIFEKGASFNLLVPLDAIDIPGCRVKGLLGNGLLLLLMEDAVGGQAAQPTIISGRFLVRLRRRTPIFTGRPETRK